MTEIFEKNRCNGQRGDCNGDCNVSIGRYNKLYTKWKLINSSITCQKSKKIYLVEHIFLEGEQFGLTHTQMPDVICDITSLNINIIPIYFNSVR